MLQRISKKTLSQIIKYLGDKFKLKDLLEYFDLPKSTYMYWQQHLDRTNKDKQVGRRY